MLLMPIDVAEGIVIRHDVLDQAYVDFAAEFPFVGQLASNSNSGSGVLIGSSWVLTAAHLRNGMTSPRTFTVGGNQYAVEAFYSHPDWTGDVLDGNDIALVRLAEPVRNIAPAGWYTGNSELGRIGVFAGYGRTGTGLTGQNLSSGVKRAGESLLERIGTDSALTPPPAPFNTLEYRFYGPDDVDVLPLEGIAAQGDSGGPVFIESYGMFLVAGVHSFIWNINGGDLGTYGDVVVSTRVAAYDDWIVAVIPEPATVALWAGVGVILLAGGFRRRRQTTRQPGNASLDRGSDPCGSNRS